MARRAFMRSSSVGKWLSLVRLCGLAQWPRGALLEDARAAACADAGIELVEDARDRLALVAEHGVFADLGHEPALAQQVLGRLAQALQPQPPPDPAPRT